MPKRSRRPVEEANLDRFAGSSAESDNNDESESEASDDEETPIVLPSQPKNHQKPRDDDDDDDDDDSEEPILQSGMASVMSKILSSKTNPTSVVLSKTKTPLQIQAQREKEDHRKRTDQAKRDRQQLACVNNETDIVRERELRRIATQGVVALFNAIAQHQTAEVTTAPTTSKKAKLSSKDGFLDLVKEKTANSSSKWQALSEDYAMKNKQDAEEDPAEDEIAQNWDEVSSEDDEQ